MAEFGASRRGVLGLAIFAACRPASLVASPSVRGGIAADFSGPGGARVAFEYWDRENFRLVPARGGAETWVVAGRIYLVARASIVTAGTERVLWVGALQDAPAASPAEPRSEGTALPSADIERWQLGAPVHDVAVAAEGPGRPALRLSVAHLPRLARAQYVVDRRMRAAMDMGLCGNGIEPITATWRPEFTGGDLAVVAADSGVRLAGPLRAPPVERPALPAGVDVEDFRLPRAG